jgi:cobalt/nickel transport system permease protein
MALVHAAIGLGEALITGMVLRFVLLVRPDLIHDYDAPQVSRGLHWGQVGLAGLGIALVVAVFLSPLASSSPDGLEWVGTKIGFLKDSAPSLVAAPIADYEMPGLKRFGGIATAVAGALGTFVVFGVAFILARIFRTGGRSKHEQPLLRSGPTYAAANSPT